eukprot:TRINITY_DN2595_c0_g4_i1.p1 TRINITY_DN2595_c0_g4~~TRINITY_DN2595_c0_g4_i1.p1  ORF type:complete len:458 (+),score=77.75 TRINITY_DN2595_c0_g4_i1:73-1446(+)
MRSFVLALALCLLSHSVYSQNPDQITSLPGLPPINFNQYAGYINVNKATGRNLFYWFVESQNDPATAPLVLWLTGGPGCSSLLGFFTELGPFWPNADGQTLSLNPYSWNNFANFIFLDSPSGVGFSFSTNTQDYTVGDARTANDTFNFIQAFLVKYPQFAKSPFYITGESYGGHYVPNLAQRIVQGNNAKEGQPINFQGFMVGNAWTYSAIDNYGAIFYWYTHAIISESTFNGLNSTCDFSEVGPLYSAPDPVACNNYQNLAGTEMGNINIYDIYVDVCLSSQADQLVKYWKKAGAPLNKMHREKPSSKKTRDQDPCIQNYLNSYLNNADVQKAIHANISVWNECSPNLNYSYPDVLSSVIPVYQFLLKAGIKILVYSGDVDAIVPVTGTRLWIESLNLPIVTDWTPWTDSNQQVGGYTVQYQGLTFATVRNAGHEVPGYQPLRASDLFSGFLDGLF